MKAVLFDVDGTLVDTNYLHTVAWWEAFARAGHDIPMAPIHRAIGMGSDKLLSALLPPRPGHLRGRGHQDLARSAVLGVLVPAPPAAWCAGAAAGLHEHGLRVVLASSADPQELQILRSVLGAEDVIHAATSAGDVEASKPAPDLVQVALRHACAEPAETVFVGDAVWDARACQRAGVRCVGVLSGGSSRDELLEAGAAAVFEGPGELLAHFPGSLLAASDEEASVPGGCGRRGRRRFRRG